MKELTVITLVLLMAVCCAAWGSTTSVKQRIHRIENGLAEQVVFDIEKGEIDFAALDRLFAADEKQPSETRTLAERMKHYHTPGVSVAVINNNQIEWAKGYGVMDAGTGVPVTTGTIFEAASVSKLVTAVMALHFVQKGLVELDKDINNYLKSWQVPENEFTENEKVTLRRLLTHRSGLPGTSYDNEDSADYPTLIDVLNGKPPALNKAAVPEFVPGSKWHYSNLGYNVIQLLLEDVSGKSFQKIAEEIIFKPLKMTDSTFIYPLDPERQKREAMPHDARGKPQKPVMHQTAVAQGGLTTTPTDLAKFTTALMLAYRGKSERILSQTTMRAMLASECEIDKKIFPLPFHQGLGVFLMGEGKDMLFTHPGNNYPGLNCWLIGWPERGTGAVVMGNSGMYGRLNLEIIDAIHREYNH